MQELHPEEPEEKKDAEAEPLSEIEDPELEWVEIQSIARDPGQVVPDLDQSAR